MYTNKLNKLAVIKFGSSVLTKEIDIHKTIQEIYCHLRENYKVIVVVSAIGNFTDHLISCVHKLYNAEIEPEESAYAELLATGENASSSLLAIALNEVGIPTIRINHHYLQTKGSLIESTPVKLNKHFITKLLKQYSVIIVPGFIGTDIKTKRTSLLGRGGSDLSAVFIANYLTASRCVLYKNTAGIYTSDPEMNKTAQAYQTISYDDCLKLSYPVIQHQAVHYSKNNNLTISVKAIGNNQETVVNSEPSVIRNNSNVNSKVFKVAILGLGTVGVGVYEYLASQPEHFEIVGIGIKDPGKIRPHFIPKHLIVTALNKLIISADIIIEVMGAPTLAYDLIKKALMLRRHVITANKFVIGQFGEELTKLAEDHHVRLSYSAAVGGVIPVLETLENLKQSDPAIKINSVYGILNGTTNFILEKITQGYELEQAIEVAQAAGFAEADASLDLDGLDAAQKLIIISQLAFNKKITNIKVKPIIKDSIEKKKNYVLKQIAECTLIDNQLIASVKPILIHNTHPLAQIKKAENCLFINTDQGEVLNLRGKGAGRWPTALAVYADLLTIHQSLQTGEKRHYGELARNVS